MKKSKDRLERKGIRVINKVVADISKSTVSDIYVFPYSISCMHDIPLSILEALTKHANSRFGDWQVFREDAGLIFWHIVQLIKLVN